MVKKVKEEKDKKEVIADFTKNLLNLMGVKVEVSVEKDTKNDAVIVNVEAGEASGLIIGNRGRTLDSIQTLISMAIRQKFGEWQRIVVDVSAWREKEEERLIKLAEQTAERVRTTGEAQQLYNLTSSQRRIVHLALSEDKDVKTESQGEGQERYLVVSPK